MRSSRICFLHADAVHLLVNVAVLVPAGAVVERRLGPGYVALAFVTGGLAGAGLSWAVDPRIFHAHARFFRRRGGRSRDVRVGHAVGQGADLSLYGRNLRLDERGSGLGLFPRGACSKPWERYPWRWALLQTLDIGRTWVVYRQVWHSARWCGALGRVRPDAQEDFGAYGESRTGRRVLFRERASVRILIYAVTAVALALAALAVVLNRSAPKTLLGRLGAFQRAWNSGNLNPCAVLSRRGPWTAPL